MAEIKAEKTPVNDIIYRRFLGETCFRPLARYPPSDSRLTFEWAVAFLTRFQRLSSEAFFG